MNTLRSEPPLAQPERVRPLEKLSYGVGDLGANIIFGAVTSFVLFYFTDVVGIGAAIAGTLLLFGRILDGLLDLVVGSLIDRTRTRWGKARPWILFSTPVLVGSFILLFNIPAGLDQTAKEILAFVFYFLCLGVGFVSSNLAYHTLLSVITTSPDTRVSLTVYRTVFSIVGGLAVNVVTIPVITALGGGQAAWSTLVLVYGLVAALTFVVLFVGTRERIAQPAPIAGSGPKLGAQVRALLGNRYFLLAFVFFLLVYLLTGVQGVNVYYARDILGDANIFSLISLAQVVPLLLGLWFMPLLFRRIGKRNAVVIGSVAMIVGVAISLVDPSDTTLFLVGAFVRGIALVPMAVAGFALVADVVDYGEWRTGQRLDGMTFAAATAGQNFGAGLGAASVGWLLAAGGYDAALSVQPESALSAQITLALWVPLAVAILLAVVAFFLNLDRYQPQMNTELAARRAGRSEDPA